MTISRGTRSFAPRPVLAAVAALSCLFALPAGAQWFGGYNAPPPYGYGGYGYARPLPPDEIVDRIEDQGFEDVRRVRLEGSVYVAEATSEGGIRTRVTVDAYRGRVIDRRPVIAGYTGPDGGPPRGRAPARGASPYDEMPESELRRRGIVGGPAPLGEAVLPEAPRPTDRGLARPTDPRLAPVREPRETPRREPRREAARPSSGQVDGVNPDARPAASSRPAPNAAPSAARSEPATQSPPAIAVRSVTSERPASSAAPAGGSKPVRVIGGVTPMGQSGSPPANQAATSAPSDAATPD